jgi:hypothetical protein
MQDRSIMAPDLMTAMHWFAANLHIPTLSPFLMSIDHSPSEIVDGLEWHHSVLVISQNVEHQLLADELGAILNPSSRTLKQWKHANQKYKQCFHNEFFHALKKHPVLVLASSIKESAVVQHEGSFADALGITGCYRRVACNGKTKVEFGPFSYSDSDASRKLLVSSKHAPMAIQVASYMLRVHTHLQAAVSQLSGVPSAPMMWFKVMSDKPPSDFTGPYAELMLLLLGGPTTHGKFTWGGFTGDDDQPIDLLADNLAGYINEITQKPNRYVYQGSPLQPPINGVFCWERLE